MHNSKKRHCLGTVHGLSAGQSESVTHEDKQRRDALYPVEDTISLLDLHNVESHMHCSRSVLTECLPIHLSKVLETEAVKKLQSTEHR